MVEGEKERLVEEGKREGKEWVMRWWNGKGGRGGVGEALGEILFGSGKEGEEEARRWALYLLDLPFLIQESQKEEKKSIKKEVFILFIFLLFSNLKSFPSTQIWDSLTPLSGLIVSNILDKCDTLPEQQASNILKIIFGGEKRNKENEEGMEEKKKEEEEEEEARVEWRDGLCSKLLALRTEVSDLVVKKVVKGLRLMEE